MIFKSFLFFLLTLISTSPLLSRQDNELLQAMRDEINRSMSELSIESLQKPYYIEYKLTLRDVNVVKSVYGSLVNSSSIKVAQLSVGVRVGDYKFDNTNFFDFGLSFFGSGDEEERFKNRNVPIELDYNSLRRELWLATDAAFKQVAETYTKKETILRNRVRKDTTHDFIRVIPEKNFMNATYPEFPKEYLVDLINDLSKMFKQYPRIQTSSVGIEYLPETTYYINNEGIEYIKQDFYTGIEIAAASQSEDGMPLANYYAAFSKEPMELPSRDSLRNATANLIKTLNALIDAPALDDAYSGPVLFEGMAAPQMFAQVFVPNLTAQRSQMTDMGFQDNERFTAFQNKIGGRVLPEFFNVSAKPLEQKFGNTLLLGNYLFDDDGVKAEDISLVENGYLKNLLSSRVPTRRVRKSNGHQRGGAAMYSNIFIDTDTEHTATNKELKERLIKLCKDRELPFGIIVRKVMDQNILFTTLFRITQGGLITGQLQNSIPLVEAYKVYPDGREELVRGAEASRFSAQSFRDIILVGNKQYALNLLAPAVTSPFVSGGSQYIMASVISGDILFEDGEIKATEDDFPKPPIIPSPLSIKK